MAEPVHPDTRLATRPGEMLVPSRTGRTGVSGLLSRGPLRVPAPELVRTPRLTLRPLLGIDRAPFLETVERSREHLEPWVPLQQADESDDAYFDRQVELCAEGDLRGTAWRRVAVLDDGRIAGVFNLNAITRGLSWEADAAWWVASDFTGLGLATEGVRAMVRFALLAPPRGLGLFSVHCGVAPGNIPSQRVAEKCGFEHRAGMHSYLQVGDRWVHHEFYLCSADQSA